MSHVATVDVEVKDLDALAEAARAVGLELIRGQTTYRWYGRHVGDYPLPAGYAKKDLGMCEHALRIPDGPDKHARAYEIGVVRRRDGKPGYALMWDFYSGGFGLEERVGKDCQNLRREYALTVATRAAVARGYQVNKQTQPGGGYLLVLR